MRSYGPTILTWSAIGILQLACSDPEEPARQPENGAVLVTLASRGNGIDPDGFSLVLGDSVFRLTAGDTLRLTARAPGNYTVRVRDVAAHCAVTPDSARVALQSNSSVTVQFSAECYGKLLYHEWRNGIMQMFYLDEFGQPRKLTGQTDETQWLPIWSPRRVPWSNVTRLDVASEYGRRTAQRRTRWLPPRSRSWPAAPTVHVAVVLIR
jgi:hypothetical protein